MTAYCIAQGTLLGDLGWPKWEYMYICTVVWKWKSLSVSDSLQFHGLYSPWNSPGQARILLEWVAFPLGSQPPTLQGDSLPAKPQGSPRIPDGVVYPFSNRSSQPRNWTGVSCIAGRFFTNWAIKEACRVETNTTLYSNYTPIKIFFFK